MRQVELLKRNPKWLAKRGNSHTFSPTKLHLMCPFMSRIRRYMRVSIHEGLFDIGLKTSTVYTIHTI